MPAGRPPIFETPDLLQDKIDEYFTSLADKKEPPTITGMCLFLGFESRQSFHDYVEKADFSYTIKKARLRIESEYEKKLHAQNPTGSIFALKNLGWSDKQEIKHEGIPERPPVNIYNNAPPFADSEDKIDV